MACGWTFPPRQHSSGDGDDDKAFLVELHLRSGIRFHPRRACERNRVTPTGGRGPHSAGQGDGSAIGAVTFTSQH